MTSVMPLPQHSPEYEMSDPHHDSSLKETSGPTAATVDLDLDLEVEIGDFIHAPDYEVIEVDPAADEDETMQEDEHASIARSPISPFPDHEINMLDGVDDVESKADADMNDDALTIHHVGSPALRDAESTHEETPTEEDLAWLEPSWDHQISKPVLEEQPVQTSAEQAAVVVHLPQQNRSEDEETLDNVEPAAQTDAEEEPRVLFDQTANSPTDFSGIGHQEAASDTDLNSEDMELAHAARVIWQETEMHLFEPPVESPLPYLLQDLAVIHRGFKDLISNLRDVLAEGLDDGASIEMEVEDMGLVISGTDEAACRATPAEILALHRQLQLQDNGEVLLPCYFTIRSRLPFTRRLEFLKQAAEAGQGLSEVSIALSEQCSESADDCDQPDTLPKVLSPGPEQDLQPETGSDDDLVPPLILTRDPGVPPGAYGRSEGSEVEDQAKAAAQSEFGSRSPITIPSDVNLEHGTSLMATGDHHSVEDHEGGSSPAGLKREIEVSEQKSSSGYDDAPLACSQHLHADEEPSLAVENIVEVSEPDPTDDYVDDDVSTYEGPEDEGVHQSSQDPASTTVLPQQLADVEQAEENVVVIRDDANDSDPSPSSTRHKVHNTSGPQLTNAASHATLLDDGDQISYESDEDEVFEVAPVLASADTTVLKRPREVASSVLGSEDGTGLMSSPKRVKSS